MQNFLKKNRKKLDNSEESRTFVLLAANNATDENQKFKNSFNLTVMQLIAKSKKGSFEVKNINLTKKTMVLVMNGSEFATKFKTVRHLDVTPEIAKALGLAWNNKLAIELAFSSVDLADLVRRSKSDLTEISQQDIAPMLAVIEAHKKEMARLGAARTYTERVLDGSHRE